MKFDSDEIAHISLLNTLCNKALKHWDKRDGAIYFSDCLRDVEVLASIAEDGERYWLIGQTNTVLLRDRSEALDMFYDNRFGLQACYTIKRTTSEHGTVRFSVELTD